MILCLKNDDIVTTLFEFDNWVWCRSKLSCEKYHFIFLSLIFNISSDLLYSSTQFVILDIKHNNFCLGMFFGESKGRGHKFVVFETNLIFSIFIIIKDFGWTWAFSSSSRSRTCTYMETQKGFGKNLAQSNFAVRKRTSHGNNN